MKTCTSNLKLCLSSRLYIIISGSHEWLLSAGVDILSYLLLPLAGPEQFTDEESDSFPLDLQFLPDDKERESDPQMRMMLLEALLKVSLIIDNIE